MARGYSWRLCCLGICVRKWKTFCLYWNRRRWMLVMYRSWWYYSFSIIRNIIYNGYFYLHIYTYYWSITLSLSRIQSCDSHSHRCRLCSPGINFGKRLIFSLYRTRCRLMLIMHRGCWCFSSNIIGTLVSNFNNWLNLYKWNVIPSNQCGRLMWWRYYNPNTKFNFPLFIYSWIFHFDDCGCCR